MSQAQLLEFGPDLRWGNLGFPDLEIKLEKHLGRVRNATDLERLIRSMRPLFKDARYSPDELLKLKKLRQRAYDRKRNPKLQIVRSVEPMETNPRIQMAQPLKASDRKHQILKSTVPKKSVSAKPSLDPGVIMSATITQQTPMPESQNEGFSNGVIKAIASINGEHFIKTAPKLLAWFIAASVVSFFLWQQSLALYETAGFTNAIYSAAGGILMIVGFAAYHSLTRSWLALFFCVYSGAYEGYLMVSGTIHNEAKTQSSAIQNNPELIFLTEKKLTKSVPDTRNLNSAMRILSQRSFITNGS